MDQDAAGGQACSFPSLPEAKKTSHLQLKALSSVSAMTSKNLAIVADFNPKNQSHLATNEAIQHSLAALDANIEICWIDTDKLAGTGAESILSGFSGLWIGPASPYKSTEGALAAIRKARECRIPLLGTCGGFQHIIMEYARNVLGLPNAQHEETDPQGSSLVISRLPVRSLGGR
jgi:CTP synthase (UTP-ammonia lyase)